MAGEQHLRLSVHGSYTVGSEEAREVWVFNQRLALVQGAVDDVGTFPSNWDVAADFAATTETDWTTDTTYLINGYGGAHFSPDGYLTDNVGPALQSFIPASNFSSRVHVLGAALYPCGTNGRAVGGNVAHLDFTTDTYGGGSGKQLPTSNSVVMSWGTHILGKRGRGRIYPPPITVDALDAYGELLDTWVESYAILGQQWLEALAVTALDPTSWHLRPVVTGPSTTHGAGAYTQYGVIDKVRVGHVIDTQRRRRNKLAENYHAVDVTY